MPSKFYNCFKVFIVTICLFFGVFSSIALADDVEDDDDDLYSNLKVFSDVLALVQRDYVEEVGSKKLVDGAIRGMLAALDPHSGYLDPDYYKDLQVQTKGHFGGLGIEITMKNGLLLVVSPMEGTPAFEAGIKAGDVIVKIDDKYTKDFSLVEAVKRLRGPKGTTVKLTIAREGLKKLLGITVVRDEIKVKSIRNRYLGDGFGYIRISQFMDNTSQDLKRAIDKMSSENGGKTLNGLIVDVRNNPGGLLTQAVAVSDMFLKDGIIVYTDGRVEGQKKKFFAHERGTEPDYPMVVLINGGSASASEIFAGAMQDHGRGLILGTRTFGKGSVQTVTPLENGGALTLTTALYYTKSGRSLQATGVAPDVEVEAPIDDEIPEDTVEEETPSFLRESELEGAIKNPDGLDDDGVLRKINKTPVVDKKVHKQDPENGDLKEWLSSDPQLSRALELLKSYNVFNVPKKAANN